MPATYTEIKKEDIERFLRARYRVYDPSEYSKDHGEFVYDLSLSDVVAVRIYSSIQRHGTSAGSGEDAIRVVLVSKKLDRPINKKAGKSIVKRTQNWRNSLSDRIEAFIEEYHEKEEFYESIAKGEQPPSRQPVQVEVTKVEPAKQDKQEQWNFDQFGNFVFKQELKEKYLSLIDTAIERFSRSFPVGYIDFLRSVQNHLRTKGRFSPKQKDAIDKVLKRTGLYSQLNIASIVDKILKNGNIIKIAEDIISQGVKNG